MSKVTIQDEIRRISNENAAVIASKALEVSEAAKAKAAEVSSLAIAKALDTSTIAAQKAADAASAAAAIAISTSKDLEYIKKDIADTKLEIAKINDKLDNKFVTKEEFISRKNMVDKEIDGFITTSDFSTVKGIVYGLCGTILISVITGLMYLLIKR